MNDLSKIENLLSEAWDQRRLGNQERAARLVKRAEKLTRDEDFKQWGRIFHILAQFEADLGKHTDALNLYRKSVECYEKSGDQDRIAHSSRHVADVLWRLGRVDESETQYRAALEIYRANPDTAPGDLANALRGFALALEKRGSASEAIFAWEEIKDLYQICNLQQGVTEAESKLENLRSAKDHDRADH